MLTPSGRGARFVCAALRPRPRRAAELQAARSRRERPGPAPQRPHASRVCAAQPRAAAGCSLGSPSPSAAPSPPLQPAAGARLRCA
jgi:hypothetical protein